MQHLLPSYCVEESAYVSDENWEDKLHKYSVISCVLLWKLILAFVQAKVFQTLQKAIDAEKISKKLMTVQKMVVTAQFVPCFSN